MREAAVGRTLAESEIRARTEASVVAIKIGETMRPNPDPNLPLPAGAELILVGDLKANDRFLKAYRD